MTFNLTAARNASLSSGAFAQTTNISTSTTTTKGVEEVESVTDDDGHHHGKFTTTKLEYPLGVGQDVDQGHWILFEILAQTPGQLAAARTKEAQAETAERANRADQAQLGASGPFGGPAAFPSLDRNQTPAPSGIDKLIHRPQHAGPANSSIQMKKKSTIRLDTVIALYMPPSVQVKYDVNYAEQEIGLLAETGFSALKAFQQKQGGLLDKTVAGVETAAGGLGAAAAQFGMTKIAGLGGIAQGAAAVIAIERGQVITPRMELMFEGMGRRSFSYSFTFIPKSENEAKVVEKIVMHFKKHMMPNFANSFTSGADGVREMTIPDHFNIRYMYRDRVNTHLNLIQTCALKSMDVDYGAERFTAYAGGRPQTTKISLNFGEFNIMSRDHIEAGH